MGNGETSRVSGLAGLHGQMEHALSGIVTTILRTAALIGGPMVEEFEAEFARFCNVRHCVAVGSGTDALRWAIMAAGIRAGSIVITVPNAPLATTEAISQAGAFPVFVDVDRRTHNMDPDSLREFLEIQCRWNREAGISVHLPSGVPISAVLPVHLYGQMAHLDAIEEIAGDYGLSVVEDASQAPGAQYFSTKQQRWKTAGSVGKAAAFSFYPGNNLGAWGKGGAITTNDSEVALTARKLRDHGPYRRCDHDLKGHNGRLNSLQAGILTAKLRHLPVWNEDRRAHATRYNSLLAPFRGAVKVPFEAWWSRAVCHLYVIQVEQRDRVQQCLMDAGVETGIHYPTPLHLQNLDLKLKYRRGTCPVAEAAADRILSLPMYPGLSLSQQQKVAAALVAATNSDCNGGVIGP